MHRPRPLSIAFANFTAPLGAVAVAHVMIDAFDGLGADKVTLVMQHGREEITTEAHRDTRSETWGLSDTTAAHIDHVVNTLAQLVHSAHPCEGPIHVYNIVVLVEVFTRCVSPPARRGGLGEAENSSKSFQKARMLFSYP